MLMSLQHQQFREQGPKETQSSAPTSLLTAWKAGGEVQYRKFEGPYVVSHGECKRIHQTLVREHAAARRRGIFGMLARMQRDAVGGRL